MSEQSLPADIREAASVEQAAERLGGLLGLDSSAPIEGTRRALAEPLFARALLAARHMPEVRDALLAGRLGVPSTGQAAGRAAAAMMKWGMQGMRPAEPWVIARRLSACRSCEFLADAPDNLVYRGAAFAAKDGTKICTLCGCLANTKAAISTELCPSRDPDHPHVSRWGDPWVAPERHPKGPW